MTNIHFASSTTHATCNEYRQRLSRRFRSPIVSSDVVQGPRVVDVETNNTAVSYFRIGPWWPPNRSSVFASRRAYSSRRADRETRDGFHYRTATCLNDRRDANSDAPAARVSVGLHDLRRPVDRRRTRRHTRTRDAVGPTRKLPAERLNGPNKDDRGRAARAGIKPVDRLYTSRSPVVWRSRIKVASGSSVDSTVPRADQPSVPTIVSTLAVFRAA